jgi:putative transposase
MYNWRRMTPEQRTEAMRHRQLRNYPMHSPPHPQEPGRHCYHLSAANFEHAVIAGGNPERLATFADTLCRTLAGAGAALHAWCALPNHYHALIGTEDLKWVLAQIGRMHGRTSFERNGEDTTRGRKCWHCCTDPRIRSDSHFFAARNYIHHNPVKHGYVSERGGWPFSSAKEFLDAVGPREAAAFWKMYPVLDMGEGWDRD